MSQPAQPFAFNVSYYIFIRFVLQLLSSFLFGALLEHSMCLNIYFLYYSLLLALVIYYPSIQLSIIEHFLVVLGFFLGRGCWPCAQPPTWRARVSLFVWLLPFDLSGLGDPTSSYATAGIALRVAEARKLPHHVKVETPSGEGRCNKEVKYNL